MQGRMNCSIEGHNNKQIISLCLQKDCKFQNKFMCQDCRASTHSEHTQQSIMLQDLFCANKDKFSIPFWPRDNEEIANQISEFLTKRQLVDQDKEIDRIFDQLKQKIIQIIEEAKLKAKESFGSQSQLINNLHEQFTQLFPITKLQSLINQTFQEQFNPEQFSHQLNELLDDKNRQEHLDEISEIFETLTKMKNSINTNSLVDQLVNELPEIVNTQDDEIQEKKKLKDLEDLYSKDLEQLCMTKQISQQSEIYKIVILGDSKVGKTSIINQLVAHSFYDDSNPTKQVSFQSVNFLNTPSKSTVFKLYDTYGTYEDLFHYNKNVDVKDLFKNSACLIIVFDITNKKSFENVELWRAHFYEFGISHCNQEINKFPIFIIGNKADLNKSREISKEEIQAWCDYHLTAYREISTKSYDEINLTFLDIYNKISKN